MQLKSFALAGAAVLLTTGVAYAQAGTGAGAVNPPGAYPSTGGSMTAGDPAAATSATGAGPVATPGDQASIGPAVVTNGPVPDTPANRRKYGGPMSLAGKRTAASGD